jgi:hypothetical protein
MLDISSHCVAREKQLNDAGLHIDEILQRAGVDRSSWTGWKCRNVTPRLDKWLLVDGEIDRALSERENAA